MADPSTPSTPRWSGDTIEYIRRETFNLEFFAWEEIGCYYPYPLSPQEPDMPVNIMHFSEADLKKLIIDAMAREGKVVSSVRFNVNPGCDSRDQPTGTYAVSVEVEWDYQTAPGTPEKAT